ncbi:MAG: hypothetical protein V4608_12555 [Bacteroidota bacterium]
MKKIISTLFTTAILITSCTNGNLGSSDSPKTAEELKMELKIQELTTPTKYLTITGETMKHNLVREAGLFRKAEYDGWIVSGIIKNSATIAKFKDIVLSITLLSQTETVIEEKNYVIYEFYESNSTKQFFIKINPPNATDKFNIIVKDAVAVD